MSTFDANVSLGLVRGLRGRTKEIKEEKIQDEDRAHKLERQKIDESEIDQKRARDKVTSDQQVKINDQNIKAGDIKVDTAGLEHEEVKRRIEDEGALDFLYEIDDGGDPTQAMLRHNARGRSKMVDGSVKYDAASKNVDFDMDSDGDGVVEHFTYNVPKTIEQLERITGKTKDRYMNVPAGGDVFDRRKGRVVASNPREGTTASNRPIRVGANDSIYNPKTGTWERPPNAGTAGADGRGVVKFNPEGYSKDATAALGRLVGGKFDPTTQQWDFGGATQKMTQLNRIVQRHAQRLTAHKGAISAEMIATVVNQMAEGFDEKMIRAKVKQELKTIVAGQTTADDYEKGSWGGLGEIKPSVLKDHQDAAVQDAIVDIDARTRQALDAEIARLGAGGPMTEGQETAVDEPDDDVDDEGADPSATDADNVPAVQPAPPAAIEFLKKNPHLKEQFRKKYGYVPGE